MESKGMMQMRELYDIYMMKRVWSKRLNKLSFFNVWLRDRFKEAHAVKRSCMMSNPVMKGWH